MFQGCSACFAQKVKKLLTAVDGHREIRSITSFPVTSGFDHLATGETIFDNLVVTSCVRFFETSLYETMLVGRDDSLANLVAGKIKFGFEPVNWLSTIGRSLRWAVGESLN